MVDSLLVVGTLGGGGIHRYVDEQVAHLEDTLAVEVHDMYSDPKGDGVVWAVRSFVLAIAAAVRFLTRSPPDVVHVHTSHRYSFYRASFYVLVAAYLWRRPVVVHVHGSSFDEFVDTDTGTISGAALDRYQSLVLDAADRVVVLSEYWRDELAGHVDPASIRVVPNAVEPDEYDPSYSDDPVRVVFVSNLVSRKGVRELVAAIDDLTARGQGFRATIAGTGPLVEEVEAFADRHDHVEYVGYVTEERKRQLLNDGTIFVLPAYAEGLPIAMLEGMAGGNAIVSTGVGSIPEVIGDENGLLVEPRDAEALADALESLVSEPERATAMGRRNHRLIRERYAWEVTVPRLLAIYEEVAGEEAIDEDVPSANRAVARR